MDINDIRVFVKLAEILNFAKTAEELYISPSSVTYSVKKIETELGQKLFNRSSHGVSLTKAGEVFFRDMESLMGTWNIAQSHLDTNSEEKIPFHIGLISMTLQDDFSAIIARFIKLNPNVQLFLDVCPIDDPSEPLRNGLHDVAFVYQDAVRGHNSLQYKFLTSIPLYLVLNKNNPLAAKSELFISDLVNQTVFTFPSSINNTLDALKRLGLQIQHLGDSAPANVVINDHKYCMALVENNLGITFIPVFPPTIKPSDNLVMRPFSKDDFQMQIGIAWKSEKKAALIQSLIEIANDYFSA